MPLIPLQDIVVVSSLSGTIESALKELKKRLEKYPNVRIVSIAFKQGSLGTGTELIAVVEAVPNYDK